MKSGQPAIPTRGGQRERTRSTRADGSDTNILSQMMPILIEGAHRPNCELTAGNDALTYTTQAMTADDQRVLRCEAAQPFIESISDEGGPYTIRVTPLLRNLNYAAFGEGLSQKNVSQHGITVILSSNTNDLTINANPDGSYQMNPQFMAQVISTFGINNHNLAQGTGVTISGNMKIEEVNAAMTDYIDALDVDSVLPTADVAISVGSQLAASKATTYGTNRTPTHSFHLAQPLMPAEGDEDEEKGSGLCPPGGCHVM